jgi:hypothetical protein
MASTTVGGVRTSAAIARGYRDGQPVPPWELGEMPGTGDICSTVSDLARYAAAVHSGSLLTGVLCGRCAPCTPRSAVIKAPVTAG